MKRIFTFILSIGFCGWLVAQQTHLAPQYSMYMLNPFSFNPAYAGLDNSLSITGVFRKQWAGLEGSPTTQNINVHMPLYIARGGFGISVENEELGAERNTSALLAYNYWIPVNKTSMFVIGVSGGFVQKTLDGSKLRAPDGEYDEPFIINHNDSRLPVAKESAQSLTAAIGIYYQSERFEGGIAANNLIGGKFSIEADELLEIEQIRNYFITFGGHFDIGRDLSIHPSIMLKSDMTYSQAEISTIVRYNGNIFGGVAFRGYNNESIDAMIFMAGFKLSEKLSLAYSYDWTLSDLNSVSSGSHEIMFNYNLNKTIGGGVPPGIIYNPRFL